MMMPPLYRKTLYRRLSGARFGALIMDSMCQNETDIFGTFKIQYRRMGMYGTYQRSACRWPFLRIKSFCRINGQDSSSFPTE